MEFGKCLCATVTESVCFIDKDIAVLICALSNNLVELTERFNIVTRDIKLLQYALPIINKDGRADEKFVCIPVKAVCQHCANVCFSKANDIRNENAVVGIQLLTSLSYCIHLILQTHITVRQQRLKIFLVSIDFFLKELVQRLQVELIRCDVSAHPCVLLHGFDICVADVSTSCPKLFKLVKSKLHISIIF